MKETLIKYTAPLVLLLVAVIHFFLTNLTQVSPWKVGGFGMFSTIASPHTCFVRAYYQNSGNKKSSIQIPHTFSDAKKELCYFPSAKAILSFKQNLSKEKWIASGDTLSVATNNSDTTRFTINKSNILIEVWQLEFDAKTAKVSTALIAKN